MIECLGGKKHFNRKSIYRALGVIGHFYGDMDKEKVKLDCAIHIIIGSLGVGYLARVGFGSQWKMGRL